MADLKELQLPHRRAPRRDLFIPLFARHRAGPRCIRDGGNRRRLVRAAFLPEFGEFAMTAGAMAKLGAGQGSMRAPRSRICGPDEATGEPGYAINICFIFC